MTNASQAAASSATPGTEVIRATDVSKRFGDTQALERCNFAARAGEIHAIVGENGSGKSTLAKAMSGIFRPDHGVLEVLGGIPDSPARASELGLATVFQEVLVCEGQSVLDNLYVGTDGTWRPSMPLAEKLTRATETLRSLTGTEIDLEARIETLTLSQRQWVTIARALLRDPKVLILDEATAALDLDGAKQLLRMMGDLKARGVCVLIVTHRIAELTAFADRATVLRDGVTVGTVERDELNESRLLAMMSGTQVAQSERSRSRPQRAAGRATLKASGLRLTPQSESFDVEVCAGEIVGVTGLDGHGQGAFVRTLAGIVAPAEGAVVVASPAGEDQTVTNEQAAARAGVAYISGDRKLEGIFPNLSIYENFGAALFRDHSRAGVIRGRRIRQLYRESVATLSVRVGRASAPIGSLSGGNQQKILIGRALARSPHVVLLNDPTRGVDLATKHDLYDLLERLTAEGRAVVFMSSEIEEFVGVCDRVLVFRMGTLHRNIPAEEVSVDRVLAAMFGQTGDVIELAETAR